MTPSQLQDFMTKHKLSVLQIADLLGVSHMAPHHWLVGKRAISLTTSRLLRLFDKYPELMSDFNK